MIGVFRVEKHTLFSIISPATEFHVGIIQAQNHVYDKNSISLLLSQLVHHLEKYQLACFVLLLRTAIRRLFGEKILHAFCQSQSIHRSIIGWPLEWD